MGISFDKMRENWDRRFETATLDEFRDHLEVSVRGRQRSLQIESDGLTVDQFSDSNDIEGYRMHLEDQMSEVWDVQHLADELSILALYKQVELHTKRVAARNFSASEVDKILDYRSVTNIRPLDISTLANFSAIDELRLINNAIKHEGKVTQPLANSFPTWVLDSEFKELGAAYLRLAPLVKSYVQDFVSASYANSTKLRHN